MGKGLCFHKGRLSTSNAGSAGDEIGQFSAQTLQETESLVLSGI
jgi:hypothetical protein